MDLHIDDDSELTRQAKRGDVVQLFTAQWGDLTDSHDLWNTISAEVASKILDGVEVATQGQAENLAMRLATYLYASTLYARKLTEVAVVAGQAFPISAGASEQQTYSTTSSVAARWSSRRRPISQSSS